MVLDVLAAGLSGGRASHPGAPPAKGNNVLFMAFAPEHFSGIDTLLGESTGLVRYLRDTPTAPGFERITLPGDPERTTMAKRSVQGIPLEDAHWERLVELATKQGLTAPSPSPAVL